MVLERQAPVTRQTLPERSASVSANGDNPRVWRTTQLGANTDVRIKTEAEEKWTQQQRVIFTVLESSINTHALTQTHCRITPSQTVHLQTYRKNSETVQHIDFKKHNIIFYHCQTRNNIHYVHKTLPLHILKLTTIVKCTLHRHTAIVYSSCCS